MSIKQTGCASKIFSVGPEKVRLKCWFFRNNTWYVCRIFVLFRECICVPKYSNITTKAARKNLYASHVLRLYFPGDCWFLLCRGGNHRPCSRHPDPLFWASFHNVGKTIIWKRCCLLTRGAGTIFVFDSELDLSAQSWRKIALRSTFLVSKLPLPRRRRALSWMRTRYRGLKLISRAFA